MTLLLHRWLSLRRRIRGQGDGLQEPMQHNPLPHGEQSLDRQSSHWRCLKARRGGIEHPSWDFQVNSIGSTHRDGMIRSPRWPDYLQLLAEEWVKAVVDDNF